MWATFAELKLLHFLSAISISGVMATPDDVNIIAIEKVIPENIGTVGILFYVP